MGMRLSRCVPTDPVAANNQNVAKSVTSQCLAEYNGSTGREELAVAANNGKPPCSQNKTHPIPKKLQATMLANGRTAYRRVARSPAGERSVCALICWQRRKKGVPLDKSEGSVKGIVVLGGA